MSAETELASLREENKALKARVDDAFERLDALEENDFDDLKSDFETLGERVDTLENECVTEEVLDEKIEDFVTEETLTEKVDELSERIDSLESPDDEPVTQSTFDELVERVDTTESDISDMKDNIEEAKTEATEAKEKAEEVDSRVDDLPEPENTDEDTLSGIDDRLGAIENALAGRGIPVQKPAKDKSGW